MTNVTISELPAAAVPYPTGSLFELSVPDGIGGFNSFKGTLADIVAATLVEPIVTVTGTWPSQPQFVVMPSFGMQASGIFAAAIGGAVIDTKDIGSFVLDAGFTAVAFPNLVGISGRFDFDARGLDLASISAPELVVVRGSIDIIAKDNGATTFDLSALKYVGGGLVINNCSTMVTVNLAALEYSNQGIDLEGLTGTETLLLSNFFITPLDFILVGLSSLTVIDVAALAVVGHDIVLTDLTDLPSLDLSSLTSIGRHLEITNAPLLASLDLSALVTLTGNLALTTVTSLSALDFHALTTLGGITEGSTGVLSLTLPVIETLGPVNVNFFDLVTFTLGASLKTVTGDFFLNSAADQASVDNILVRLAALDGTGGTTSYDGHTITLQADAAAPSATGLAAIATLQGRGNTVNTN